MKQSEVLLASTAIRNKLKQSEDFKENPIDTTLDPVLPFTISENIALIVIGQDPTVQNEKSRSKIKYTLNLDKNGSLKTYMLNVCRNLEIPFENIYATNVFKYFYTSPPQRTMSILHDHLHDNLDLLKRELILFPNVPIITLGLPVLQLLTDRSAQVNHYWDYNKKTKVSDLNYRRCLAKNNKLDRDLFPLPHQPSLRKSFYKNHLDSYLNFMKKTT